MNVIDGIRFNDSNQTVIFSFHSWVELFKAIIVKYANKNEHKAEHLVLASLLVCNPENDYMSVVIRGHESEYH